MNLIQFKDQYDFTYVGIVENQERVRPLEGVESIYEIADVSIKNKVKLTKLIDELETGDSVDYQQLVDDKLLLSPIQHPDPAHCFITGTGLTHLGSADTRAAMHKKLQANESELTDSMRMFRLGVEGGKPNNDERGVQPEWFYKGDGSILVAPEQALAAPGFALDGGEEPEICGIYLIGPDATPYRLGFALGNEFSDHKMEQINYLYLAHSKLRACAIGPELRLGPLPGNIKGQSRIKRQGQIVWKKEFLSGEDNMCHSIANLEAHHFKYQQFLRPGDIHIHFFGTGTLSFGDGFETNVGDVFEIESTDFGRPLRNTLKKVESKSLPVKTL